MNGKHKLNDDTRILTASGFSVLLLILILSGIISYSIQENLVNNFEEVSAKNVTKMQLVNKMHAAVRNRSSLMLEIVQAEDYFHRDELTLDIDFYGTEYIVSMTALLQGDLDDRERNAIEVSYSIAQKLHPTVIEWRALIFDNEMLAAEELLHQTIMPMQQKVFSVMSELQDYTHQRSLAALRHTASKAQPILDLLVALGFAAVATGLAVAVFVMRRSVHIEKRLNTQEWQSLVTLESIGDAVVTVDSKGVITFMNYPAETIFATSCKEAMGKSICNIARLVNDETKVALDCEAMLSSPENFRAASREVTKLVNLRGVHYVVEVVISPIRSPLGEVVGRVLVFRDVTESRQMAQKIEYQATHDALTLLINRTQFEKKARELISDARNNNHQHALLYIDLDQFKIINDTSGHSAGDELLRQIARQLSRSMRQDDTLARLGGDEFGVLLTNCEPEKAQALSQRILDAVRDLRFAWKDKYFTIGASIGLVPITAESPNFQAIMTAADAACYTAKDKGRNRIHTYTSSDEDLIHRGNELDWVCTIKEALRAGSFTLYAQKIAALNPEDTTPPHYEILIRMLNQKGEIVPPLAFLPAAERYGLMPSIDRWVIREAIAQIEKHAHVSVKPIIWSINLSGQSFCDEGFLQDALYEIEGSKVDPSLICFEITETAAISNLVVAEAFIRQLREKGCRFSLDDFGSGVSSFGYLRQLPVDFIKIDGVFIRDILSDPINQAMVEAINHVGHIMHKQIIAEFVQDEASAELLRKLGIEYAQGYGIEKPRPLIDILNEHTPSKLKRLA